MSKKKKKKRASEQKKEIAGSLSRRTQALSSKEKFKGRIFRQESDKKARNIPSGFHCPDCHWSNSNFRVFCSQS